jgi:hypothetical protein
MAHEAAKSLGEQGRHNALMVGRFLNPTQTGSQAECAEVRKQHDTDGAKSE